MADEPSAGAVVVDADAHINEEDATWCELDALRPGWHRYDESAGRRVHLIEGKLYPLQEGPGCGVPSGTGLLPGVTGTAREIDLRLDHLDAEGIDVQVLFGGLAIAVTSFEDAGFALDFAACYNDWLLGGVCLRSPGRLRGVAIVPLQDPARAAAELARAVHLGAVAVTIPPVVGPLNLDDPSFDPFFAEAAAADLAVAVHGAPGMHVPLPAAGRFANYAQVHCLSFPVDQMVALTSLVMGGVLDRHPGLRIAFLESGIGWVPYYLHRMAEHREKRGPLLPGMRSDPRDLIAGGRLFFSFEAEDDVAGYVAALGPDSLVYASDYPHWDAEFPGGLKQAWASAASAGPDVPQRVFHRNAVRLYGL